MSKIFFSVLFLFPFISEAQSLKDAKRYFENYEYDLLLIERILSLGLLIQFSNKPINPPKLFW